MKIVAVTTWYPTGSSPSLGAFVEKDVEVLSRDHEVEVVHLVPPSHHDGEAVVERNGVTVRRVVMSTQRPDHVVRAARELRPLLRGADLVHTMAFSALLPFGLGRPDVPWVHTEHWSGLTNPSTLPASWRVALPALRPLLARPDVVTAVCDYLARPIRAVRPGRTVIVPCIVPAPRPLPARPERTEALRLAAVGGLIDRKDPVLAVETIAALLERDVVADLTWVGSGPLRDRVLERARELGVADRVHLAGVQDARGVSRVLADADMFFLPTRADNFCVSAAEALVHGRPVVVGATGGQGEYIEPEVGSLVGVQDAGAYADAILATDDRTRALDAAQIAGTIGDRFSPEAVQDGYAGAYRDALRTRGGTRR
ncbi:MULTISPECIES: glycosyltransferase [Cellulosimicrobium]|nr:glycosyltransferase [Cellulosimicrobium cellulans]QDP76427.1 glycosyltransferase family 4 protein [Cellulosimicrobium cellulans]